MADVVVCVPRAKWRDWVGEGSLAGQSATELFGFYVRTGERPPVEPGDRVYVVAWDRLRGYAPLVELREEKDGYTFVRAGGAVACTLPVEVKGFPGWKLRWWQRTEEVPFLGWQVDGVGDEQLPKAMLHEHTDPKTHAELLAEAERIEAAAWLVYRRAYLAEMVVSSGRDVPQGWERDVIAAKSRGVVPHVEAWQAELVRERRVYTCFCTADRRERCHAGLLAQVMQRLGATYLGEFDPPTKTNKAQLSLIG
jgi:hypothetical protein